MPLPSKTQAASIGLVTVLHKDSTVCVSCHTRERAAGFLMCTECRQACGAHDHHHLSRGAGEHGDDDR